jgi:hypothetical protein
VACDQCSEVYEPHRAPGPNGAAPATDGGGGSNGKINRQPNGKPIILGNHRQLPAIVADGLAALRAINDPPVLFVRGEQLAAIRHGGADDGFSLIVDHNVSSIRNSLARAANWEVENENGRRFEGPPPTVVCQDVLESHSEYGPGIPPLRGVINAPIFSPAGRLIATPGYHSDLAIYYAGNGEIPTIPDHPSQEQLAAAVEVLRVELFKDFPFRYEASMATAFSALFTPVVRHCIHGPTPIHLFEAPQPRTGKGLLAEVIAYIAAGGASITTLDPDENDLRKKLTALLIQGTLIVQFDNVNEAKSPVLALTVTEPHWTDRILGVTRVVRIPIECTWFMTGNNVRLAADLPARTLLCTLDANSEHPELRKGFRHPNLMAYVRENVAQLRSALYTILRYYFDQGTPAWDGTPLGRFEEHSRVIGGILELIGMGKAFMANRREWAESADTDKEFWVAFVKAWYAQFKSGEVTAKALWEMAQWGELLENVRKSPRVKDEKLALARALGRKIGNVIAGFKIERGGEDHRGTGIYKLTPVKE